MTHRFQAHRVFFHSSLYFLPVCAVCIKNIDHILRHWYQSNEYILQAILLLSFEFRKIHAIDELYCFICVLRTFRIHKFYHVWYICSSVHKLIRNLCPILSTVNERQKKAKINNFFKYLQLAPWCCLNTCILPKIHLHIKENTFKCRTLVCHTYRMNTN